MSNPSTDPKILCAQARQTRDPRVAVELYSEAIKYEKASNNPDPNFLSEVHLLRGEIYLGQGVALLSSSDFMQAISYNPNNGGAHNYLGMWFTTDLFATPDYARALEHTEKAIECCPDRQDIQMNRAIIKLKSGDTANGRFELEQLYNAGYADAKLALEKFCPR